MKTSISQKIIKALVATLAIGVIASACGSSSSSRQRNATVATCAQGGTCVIGDTGPGGGIVFYVSTTLINAVPGVSSGGYYLEVAPVPRNATSWCEVPQVGYWSMPNLETPYEIGYGASNSLKMKNACSGGAANSALDLNLGGKDDWFLPSPREADAFLSQWPLNSGDQFWSSSQLNQDSGWLFGYRSYPQIGYWNPNKKNSTYRWYAARAFGTAELVNTPTTTTTIPVPLKHVVQSGESLFSIGQMYSVKMEAIIELNNMDDPDKLAVGDEILLPQGSVARVAPVTSTSVTNSSLVTTSTS